MAIKRGLMHLQLELLRELTPLPCYSETLPALKRMYADLPIEELPWIRLAAALVRSAIADIRIAAVREAVALGDAIVASEEPADEALAEQARVTGGGADEALEQRNLAIAWFNGAEAPITFEAVCRGFSEWPHRMREVIAQKIGLTTSGPQELLDTTEVV